MASRRCSSKASRAASSSPVGSSSLGLREQQARFEIGEPGGHHEIIGRQIQPELAGLGDEERDTDRQARQWRSSSDRPSGCAPARARDRAAPRSPRHRRGATRPYPRRVVGPRSLCPSQASSSSCHSAEKRVQACSRLSDGEGRRWVEPFERCVGAPSAAAPQAGAGSLYDLIHFDALDHCSEEARRSLHQGHAPRARRYEPASAFIFAEMSSDISRPSKPIWPRIISPMMTGESVAARSASSAL